MAGSEERSAFGTAPPGQLSWRDMGPGTQACLVNKVCAPPGAHAGAKSGYNMVGGMRRMSEMRGMSEIREVAGEGVGRDVDNLTR